MMSCVNVVLRQVMTAEYGAIKQVLKSRVAHGWLRGYELQQVWTL